jgi:FSR family fosmidomycin resistance protein-like MFS transporter
MTQPAAGNKIGTHQVLTISAGHAVHDTFTSFLPPLLPSFIERWALTKTEAGALALLFQAPSLLQPYIGHLADRFNLRYIVILAPAVSTVLMCLLGIAPGYGLLALFLLLAGLSSAAFHSTAPVMAGTLSKKNLGRGMGIWMLGGELGRTLGPLVAVTTVSLVTLAGLPVLMVAGMVTSFVLFHRLKDIPVRPPDAGPSLPWRTALGRMKPVFLPLSGVIVLRAFMLSSLTIFLPTYLTEHGAGLWSAGAALSVYEAAGVAGALAGGWLSDRVGRRAVLVVSMLLAPVLLVLFLNAWGWSKLLLLSALGFTGLSIAPVIMALVQESFPENRAFANGVYMLISFGMRGAAVVIVGAVGDMLSLQAAFFASAVLMLLGSPIVFLLPAGRPGSGPRLRSGG